MTTTTAQRVLELEVARELCGSGVLLTAYSGDEARAARDAAGAGRGASTSTVAFECTGSGRVTYRSPDGTVTGTTTARAMVHLAMSVARKGAVDRLTAAVTAHRRSMDACHRYIRTHGDGGNYLRPGTEHDEPYGALVDVMSKAGRELYAARDAWWDGSAPGEQLDLFGAVTR